MIFEVTALRMDLVSLEGFLLDGRTVFGLLRSLTNWSKVLCFSSVKSSVDLTDPPPDLLLSWVTRLEDTVDHMLV